MSDKQCNLKMADIRVQMSNGIFLANAVSSKSKKAKDLFFYPYSLNYEVRFIKFDDELSGSEIKEKFDFRKSFKDPQDAIDYYNTLCIKESGNE